MDYAMCVTETVKSVSILRLGGPLMLRLQEGPLFPGPTRKRPEGISGTEASPTPVAAVLLPRAWPTTSRETLPWTLKIFHTT